MTKTKLFLLLGTSLSFISLTVNAQCVATQDCATLGYTETSCNGGKGVKCPFGNKWACFKSTSECEQLFCDKYGFKYTCSGTGYIGGSGVSCGGKYTQCTCASGYEWKKSSCQKQPLNGAQGNLYYCNDNVVGVKTSGMNFYVAIKDLGFLDWNNAKFRGLSYIFCNSAKGTFPSSSQLQTIYKNKSAINNLLSTNEGIKITEGFYWSYTRGGSYTYYTVNMSDGIVSSDGISNEHYARMILTSW